MRGIRLGSKKRKQLIEVYLTQGYRAAIPLAREYGISEESISAIARNCGYYISDEAGKIAEARQIISEFMTAAKIGRDDLFRSMFPHCMEARIEVIQCLLERGFKRRTIAEATGLHTRTVRYWADPVYRSREIGRKHPELRSKWALAA